MSPTHKKIPTQTKIGTIKHDAKARSLAAIELVRVLKSNRRVRIKSPESKKGPKSDFTQLINEILVDGESVYVAAPGMRGTIEIRVAQQAYENDLIYLIRLMSGGGGGGGNGRDGKPPVRPPKPPPEKPPKPGRPERPPKPEKPNKPGKKKTKGGGSSG